MKIVFPVFVNNSEKDKSSGVWGDELLMRTVKRELEAAGHEVDVISKAELEGKHYDLAVYPTYNMMHYAFLKEYADKNILWIQGFNYDGNGKLVPLDVIYDQMKQHYDLVITSARGLARKVNIPFVVPAVDFERYTPKKEPVAWEFDVSFIGNPIKPHSTHEKFFSPMSGFKYGLFGGDFGKIAHDRWQEVVWGTKVNLHFGFEQGIEWDMVTSSALYLPASKGFALLDKVPFYMETFGDSIAYTDGGDDELEQIERYIGDESLREKMAARAYEAVRSLDYSLLPIVKGV